MSRKPPPAAEPDRKTVLGWVRVRQYPNFWTDTQRIREIAQQAVDANCAASLAWLEHRSDGAAAEMQRTASVAESWGRRAIERQVELEAIESYARRHCPAALPHVPNETTLPAHSADELARMMRHVEAELLIAQKASQTTETGPSDLDGIEVHRTPAELRKAYGVSQDTLVKRIANGTIKARRINSKLYAIDRRNLPQPPTTPTNSE